MNYNYYHSLVLSKTDGSNVHKVNGLLGNILNNLSNIQYYQKIADKQNEDRLINNVNEAMKEIGGITGVCWTFDMI